MNRRDIIALLMIAILVLIFVAYELAGLLLPAWHTISFFAQNHLWLFFLILVLLALSGPFAAVWWVAHIRRHGRIPK